MFEHKNIHKDTWVLNDNRTRNQIDHVLVNAAGNVMDVRSRRGADADSDQFLVHAKIKLRIKNIARKVQQTADNIRWKTDKLRKRTKEISSRDRKHAVAEQNGRRKRRNKVGHLKVDYCVSLRKAIGKKKENYK